MIRKVEIIISGSMLGQNFLSSVERLAVGLGVQGAAFFRNDGSVKVIAEGEEVRLVELIRKLRGGRIFSIVENFYVKWLGVEESRSFHVLTT